MAFRGFSANHNEAKEYDGRDIGDLDTSIRSTTVSYS